MFDTPDDRSASFSCEEHKGALIAVRVTGTGTADMDWGPSDYITGDVTVIEGPHAHEQYDDAAIFGKFIYQSLKRKVGRTVLGVITQGTEKIKGNYPWKLEPATPEQTERAVRFMADRPDEQAPDSSGSASETGDAVPAWAR
jgi:hypothetical protein